MKQPSLDGAEEVVSKQLNRQNTRQFGYCAERKH